MKIRWTGRSPVLGLVIWGALVLAGGAASLSAQTVVKVAGAAESVPWVYHDANGQLTGYDIEVLRAVNKKLPEYKFVFDGLDQSAETVGVETGKYDIGTGNHFRTPARLQKFLFPDENFDVSLVNLAVQKGRADIKGLEDLPGKKLIPIPPEDGLYRIIKDYNDKHPDKPIKVEPTDTYDAAQYLKWVAAGQYDAFLVPAVNFNILQKDLNLDLKLTAPVSKEPTYFLLNKKQTVLKTKIDKALKELKADGTLRKLSVQFFDQDVFQ